MPTPDGGDLTIVFFLRPFFCFLCFISMLSVVSVPTRVWGWSADNSLVSFFDDMQLVAPEHSTYGRSSIRARSVRPYVGYLPFYLSKRYTRIAARVVNLCMIGMYRCLFFVCVLCDILFVFCFRFSLCITRYIRRPILRLCFYVWFHVILHSDLIYEWTLYTIKYLFAFIFVNQLRDPSMYK